jgi:spermidine/putrescine transport system permease protein
MAVARQVGPVAAFYAVFFVIPLSTLLLMSFWSMRGFDVVPAFTLSSYTESLSSGLYRTVLLRAITVGFGTACIVTPAAYIFCYLLRFTFPRRAQLLVDLALLSLFSGYLVRIYAWRTILGREGILNSFLLQLGVIQEPLRSLMYSSPAVLLTLAGLLLPLAVLPIFSSMVNISSEHVEAARDLGSRARHVHLRILVPMALPGIKVAFALTFLLAAGDFVVPSLVGGTQGVMVGNVIADQFRGIGSNWPLGAALAFLALGASMLVYLAVAELPRFMRRAR